MLTSLRISEVEMIIVCKCRGLCSIVERVQVPLAGRLRPDVLGGIACQSICLALVYM